MVALVHGGLCSCYGARYSGLRLLRFSILLKRGLATVADYVALPSPSSEQELVIKAIKQGRNARVTAVAGSGKTTTILQVAKAFPERKILGTGLLNVS